MEFVGRKRKRIHRTGGKRSNWMKKRREIAAKARADRLERLNERVDEILDLAPNFPAPPIAERPPTPPIGQLAPSPESPVPSQAPRQWSSPLSSPDHQASTPPPVLSLPSSPTPTDGSRSPPILSPMLHPVVNSLQHERSPPQLAGSPPLREGHSEPGPSKAPTSKRTPTSKRGVKPGYSPRRPQRARQLRERKEALYRRKIEPQRQLQVTTRAYFRLTNKYDILYTRFSL